MMPPSSSVTDTTNCDGHHHHSYRQSSSSCSLSNETKKKKKKILDFRVRLHLVRHGETEANRKHIVCGQSDSPLSALGMEQCHKAKNAIRSILFWRRYSSDLQRCQNTTKRILGISSSYPSENGENNNDNMVNYELDQRLRERAKGAREGKDKSLTYDEALIKWHLEQQLNNKNIVNIIPLLEMEQDVWKRAQDWIQDVVHLAYNNYSELIHHDENDEKNHHWNQQTRKISNDQKQQKQLIQHEIDDNGMFIFHVLAVTHSGTLRIMINEMVGEQLPTIGTKTTTTDKDGVKIKQLEIPNTSITAIDIIPIDCSSSRRSSIKDYDEADRYNGITHNNNLVDDEDDDINEQSSSITWTSKLIELTNIDHLKGHYNIDRN